MGASEYESLKTSAGGCRMWVEDPAGFTASKMGRLKHDYHRHPLLQVPELEALAKELAPLAQCRFVRPGLEQSSSFVHASEHPDGRDVEEVFSRIEEPGSWIALYNIEAIPRYKALLGEILDNVRATVEREQPGIFNLTGFVFISAPPSVTPFHIDRENNFWLQLHGKKTMNVWDPADRKVLPSEVVEDFIVAHKQAKVRLQDGFQARSREFHTEAGDGIYFPSTSPHMTRSAADWTRDGDRVTISLAVTFYTSATRNTARVHQVNRLMRKVGLSPTGHGESPRKDALKAPIGRIVGTARASLTRLATPVLRFRRAPKPPPGSY